jgi:hypothetical protein
VIVDDVGHRLDRNAGVRCHVLERCGHRRTMPTITTLYFTRLQRTLATKVCQMDAQGLDSGTGEGATMTCVT